MKDYGHLTNLDVLRGLAALSVAVQHFSGGGIYLGTSSVITYMLGKGYLGVDVFFVISGFIIPWSLHQAGHKLTQIPIFLFRRFVRLYPSYVAACVLLIFLWYTSSMIPWFHGGSPHFTFKQLIAHATLTCDFAKQVWLIPVCWTLPVEAQYYCLIGFTFPLLVSKHVALRYITVVLWFLFPWLIPVAPYVFPYCALFGFGIVVFMGKKNLIARPMIIILLCMGFIMQGIFKDWPSSIAALLTSVFIWRVPTINSRLLIWMGTISYSLYLIHIPIGGRVLNLYERLPHEYSIKWLGLVLACGVTIAASYIFYIYIERPSHRWARKIGARPVLATIKNNSLGIETNLEPKRQRIEKSSNPDA